MRADVRKHLAYLSSDDIVQIPCTIEKGITLTVTILVYLQYVNKKPLGVDRFLEIFQSNCTNIQNGLTILILLIGLNDKNCSLFPNSHDMILFCPLVCNRVASQVT